MASACPLWESTSRRTWDSCVRVPRASPATCGRRVCLERLARMFLSTPAWGRSHQGQAGAFRGRLTLLALPVMVLLGHLCPHGNGGHTLPFCRCHGWEAVPRALPCTDGV